MRSLQPYRRSRQKVSVAPQLLQTLQQVPSSLAVPSLTVAASMPSIVRSTISSLTGMVARSSCLTPSRRLPMQASFPLELQLARRSTYIWRTMVHWQSSQSPSSHKWPSNSSKTHWLFCQVSNRCQGHSNRINRWIYPRQTQVCNTQSANRSVSKVRTNLSRVMPRSKWERHHLSSNWHHSSSSRTTCSRRYSHMMLIKGQMRANLPLKVKDLSPSSLLLRESVPSNHLERLAKSSPRWPHTATITTLSIPGVALILRWARWPRQALVEPQQGSPLIWSRVRTNRTSTRQSSNIRRYMP